MKKLLLILAFVLAGANAYAQFADSTVVNHVLKRRGSHVKLDGQRLSREQQQLLLSDIDGIDYNHDWKKARGWRAAGIGMVTGGSALAVFGAGFTLVYLIVGGMAVAIGATASAAVGGDGSEAAESVSEDIEPYINAGLIMTGVGVATTAAGIPVIAVNCHKMSKIVKKYNATQSAPAAEITFGPTASGVGFAINF